MFLSIHQRGLLSIRTLIVMEPSRKGPCIMTSQSRGFLLCTLVFFYALFRADWLDFRSCLTWLWHHNFENNLVNVLLWNGGWIAKVLSFMISKLHISTLNIAAIIVSIICYLPFMHIMISFTKNINYDTKLKYFSLCFMSYQ